MTDYSRRRCFAAVFNPAVWAANMPRCAVVCYSRTGSTWHLAKTIARFTKADLFRIDVAVPYAAAYSDMTDVALEEVRRHAKRELKGPLPDLSAYDTIFLGSPYWWGSLSTPMNSFLVDNPLTGKAVYPFITSGSSLPEGALIRMRELLAAAKVGEHFYVSGAEAALVEADVSSWLRQLRLL